MRTPDVALGWVVLALVFLDELLAVAAAYVWGAHVSGWALGLVAATTVVAVWALFASPRAACGGPLVRPAVKVLVLLGAGAGLWAADHPRAAVVLWVFSAVVNATAQRASVLALVENRSA